MPRTGVPATSAPRDINEEARKTLQVVMGAMAAAAPTKAGVVLFPAGIDLIYVKVEVQATAQVKLSAEIKIAGPKAPGLEVAPAIGDGKSQESQPPTMK